MRILLYGLLTCALCTTSLYAHTPFHSEVLPAHPGAEASTVVSMETVEAWSATDSQPVAKALRVDTTEPRALDLHLVPGRTAGQFALVVNGGDPGQRVRLMAAPAGAASQLAQPLAQVVLDGNGGARLEVPRGVKGLETFAVSAPSNLLFGPLVSGVVSVPPLPPATGTLLPKAGDLIVSEIHKDPSAVSDSKGEWIELYNTTAQPIDIEGWILSDLGTDATQLDNGGAGIVIPPRGYGVLARELDPAQNGGLAPLAAYSSFTLSNGDDEVVLSRPGGLLVDEVRYEDAGWPDTAGATLQLSNTRLAPLWNDAGSNWCTATSTYGAGDLGTPGTKNEDC